MKSNMIALVQRDLILIENQIPFPVLKELSFKFGDENKKKITFNQFFAQIRSVPPPTESWREYIKKFLSDLAFGGRKAAQDVKRTTGIFDGEPAHLLDLMRSNLFDKSVLTKLPPCKYGDFFAHGSAKELKAVRFRFRLSKTSLLTDVDFKSGYLTGTLKFPPICIVNSTKYLLLNTVAYESSIDGLESPDDFGVSSYICLMASLIDHAEEVKELLSGGVLLNFLGSDQQVADLFNEMGYTLVSHPALLILLLKIK
ncbi:hypothetical protein Pint_20110 [Pistacia integerrima]|uniref:Uncharacterized protein n=1 Tax=Pistacia integerrima TaxID=434235 RepID=A0ACC0XA87_9ROSI|nr:hypothetical protein Pint_20110 [Pistacia integerrima]